MTGQSYDFDRWIEDKRFHEARHARNDPATEELDPAEHLPAALRPRRCRRAVVSLETTPCAVREDAVVVPKRRRRWTRFRAWLRASL